jgi:hypothetical protein
MEWAARRRGRGVRNIAGEDDAGAGGPARRRGGLGHGGEEGPGVGVGRIGGEGVGGSGLDDAAEIHDGDAVTDVTDDGEVVCNKKIGEAQSLLQAAEQVEDLSLDGDIESGDGLIADDEVGFDGESAGDADALALAAAEFVGVARCEVGAESDELEELFDALAYAAAGEAMDIEDFADGLADGHARVERAERILENDLGSTPEATEAIAIEGSNVGAVEEDAASARLDEAEDGATGRGLAGAGLTDEAEGLAAADLEGDAIDGAE